MPDPLLDAETLKLGPENTIQEIGKRPQSYSEIQGQYMGLIRVGAEEWPSLKEHFDQIPNPEKICMTDFLQSYVDAGHRLQALEVNHGWLEVDTVADLNFYENSLDPKYFDFDLFP
jgi:choline kinase